MLFIEDNLGLTHPFVAMTLNTEFRIVIDEIPSEKVVGLAPPMQSIMTGNAGDFLIHVEICGGLTPGCPQKIEARNFPDIGVNCMSKEIHPARDPPTHRCLSLHTTTGGQLRGK